MSIQDESFPYDDDLEFSQESSKNFVFPHHKPRRNNVLPNKNTNDGERGLSVQTNISSSSPLENHGDSTQSSNEFCSSSETSGKTNASEPNNLPDSESKKSQLIRSNNSKSVSYQDIHSEYTKRRYKHVESKVGQYIANMKAQDEKRRKFLKFHRHSSMPETLHGRETASAEMTNDDTKTLGLLRCSTNDLDRITDQHNELQQSDHQYHYNYDNLTTTTTSSLSNKDSASDTGIVLDKQTYELLINEKERNEYLETKVKEKNAENWRLKQNLDNIRIEYSLFKDKVKQQIQSHRLSNTFASINATEVLAKKDSMLQSKETHEKSTQTDKLLTASPIPNENKADSPNMFVTPLTSDSNNNFFDHAAMGMFAPIIHKESKSVATIQPLALNFSNLVDQELNNSNMNTTMGFLRQRSNSMAARKKSTPLTTNISKTSSIACSDSAMDIQMVTSPTPRRQEFAYFDQQSECCIVETSNDPNLLDTRNNSNCNKTMSDAGGLLANNGGNNKNRRKRRNLRSRVLRFFGACAKCQDANTTSEVIDSQLSQHSQIPLLERGAQN